MLKLSQKSLKSPKGQILIIFLLVLVVGMAIVISLASRTVTDIRISTTSDESNRAYFAAEAGIEDALRRTGATDAISLVFPNNTTASVSVNPTGSGTFYNFGDRSIAKDDVGQLSLVNNYEAADPTATTSWSGTAFNVYWNTPGGASNQTAIEVAILYYCATACPTIEPGVIPSSKFGITKVLFNPNSGGPGCLSTASGAGYTHRASATLYGTETSCAFGIPSGVGRPLLARIKPLHNSTQLGIQGNVSFPAQEKIIESVGRTSSGVTRRLQVTKSFPMTPSIFDYVLYSNSDIIKPAP